ncbi:GNAT family N-acetyltransferase [Agrococcus baldri]|uniref:N-acetyltransferase n=1 Tax=Agrococcus baldri TaxID=153730 RepID=A0AA87UQR3_9MICO|nr:GNAT family N-acetyltransferase [Agrococcus baldri]GEK78973.1 N-acetyltransferase [Agrococcus baldri]
MSILDGPQRMPLHDGFEIDTDAARLDVERVHGWLSTDAYWAIGRPIEVVRRAIDASLSFGVYDAAGAQVGYARLVTDGVTFGWLCDVYIAREARGHGLGSALAQAIVDAVEPLGIRRLLLATLDAHGVYAKAGFVVHPDPEQLMVLTRSQD